MFTQPHRTCLFGHAWHVWPATHDVFDQSCMTVLMECRSSTYQEGAEEDEGHEVWDGEVDSTLILEPIGRVWVTQPSTHARQHDLLPVLSCCTPTHTTDHWLQNTRLYPPHLQQQTEGKSYHLYCVLVLHPFKEVSFCHTGWQPSLQLHNAEYVTLVIGSWLHTWTYFTSGTNVVVV